MWPDRRLFDLLGIEHPLVLAPMAGFGTVELAAALSREMPAAMRMQITVKETLERLHRLRCN